MTITDVNGTSTATILDGEDGTGSGDMTKATYDTNDNGIVDNAEKVNNHTVLSDVPANAVFTDTTYTAGTGIAINNGVISNTQTSAEWGNITGTLSDQTDLQNALDSVEGIETLTGTEQEPVSLNTLEPGVYILKGYVQRGSSTDNLNNFYPEGRIYVLSPYSASTGGSRIVYSTNPSLSDVNIMTDFWRINRSGNMYASTGVKNLISNIKTINNQSLLGSGNITIEGGSGASVWGSITGTLSNQTDLKNTLDSKADASDIPTKTSDLTNDSGFITSSSLPTKVSDLTNDSGFITSYTETDPVFNASAAKNITSSDITNWNNKSTFSGSYNDLTNKPTIPDSTSDLTNDSGFITKSVNNLDNYTTTTDLNTALANKADSSDVPKIVYLSISNSYTSSDISTLLNNGYEIRVKDGDDISMSLAYFAPNEYVRFSTTDLSGVPIFRFLTYTFGGTWSDVDEDIPTHTSDLTNNSGFITSSVNNLTNYYTKTTIDSSLSSKQDSLVSGTNIKTINNESILGSGNITISVASVNDSYSTSTTEPYSANYVNGLTENAKPVILYENNSGSSSSITLNESVNNYRFVEVFYKGPNGSVGSTKAPVISGNTRINLHTANPYNNNMYIQNETISISGTSVTRGAQREAVMTSGTYPTIANTSIYIVCIVGY